MDLEAFVRLVASEQERTVTRTVWSTPADVLAKAAMPGGLSMTELVSAPGRRRDRREFRYAHILGEPASDQAIAAWQSQRPGHPMPTDLQAMLKRFDGIHLWADKESGRAYTGLAPLEEWEVARIKMFGATAPQSLLADRYVAISYHQDSAAFVVLDVDLGQYFLMGTAGPDATSPIAQSVGALLVSIWRTRIEPQEEPAHLESLA